MSLSFTPRTREEMYLAKIAGETVDVTKIVPGREATHNDELLKKIADRVDDIATIPAATATAIGGVKKGAAVADCAATDVAGCVTSINAILASLRAAGTLAT